MEFIRIDRKGTWRGISHCSSIAYFGEGKQKFEEGISCYDLTDPVYALEQLYKYWTENASCSNINGEKLNSLGADGEALATCTNTTKEINGITFMEKLFKIMDIHEGYDEIEYESDEDYLNALSDLICSV